MGVGERGWGGGTVYGISESRCQHCRQLFTPSELLMLHSPSFRFERTQWLLLSACPISTHISTSSNNPSFIHHQPLTSINPGRAHSRYVPPQLTLNLITPSLSPRRFHLSLCIILPTHNKSIISRLTSRLTSNPFQHPVLNIHNNCPVLLM